ncbi:hypothetical protein ROHU_025457 [Labeo rohita]|uniref:Uncharacterized protein n=1 Tax=Labeo rohita TaxID=84645 RepID=A0A498MEZ3_LABRO|nr:hypothetical protein ROHU_025457 [Labeo rohita]
MRWENETRASVSAGWGVESVATVERCSKERVRSKRSAASLERSTGRLERSGLTCRKTSLSLHLLHLTP